MSALSALGASNRTGPVAGGADGQAPSASSDQGFAKLMQTRNDHGAPEPKQKAVPGSRDKSDKGGVSKPSQVQSDTGKRRAGSTAEGDERTTAETGEASDEQTQARSERSKEEDAQWPPAGLAGMGMALLPALGAVPAAGASPLAAAGLAIGAGGALLKGAAGLLDGQGSPADAAAPGQAASAAGANASGASAAVANGGFTSLLAQAAAAQSADSDTTTASAALALVRNDDTGADSTGASSVDPINLLATAAPAPATRAIDSAAPFAASPTPTPDLHGDNFDDALGARMSWLADQKIGHAHIKINPAELGPVEVRLHLSGDQVNASFSSAQADVRQALENSLPRLREMLGQHGFQLGQADVGQQQQQASQGTPQRDADGAGLESGDDLAGGVGIPPVALRYRGLLDAYA